MTPEIALVLSILGLAIVFLVSERISMEVVALLVLGCLALTGLVSPTEALSGFSSPAVVTIWAVFILSGGLTRTGVGNIIGLPDQTMGTIPVSYMNAVEIEGNLANGVLVEIKLNGYDSTVMNYLAYKVEVEDYEYGEEKGVTGYISSLDTDADTFILTRKDMSFTVSYAAITQPGIDDLLARAQSDHLKVKVRTDAIDFMNKTITAKAIVVKVKGMLSNLAPDAYTFDVFYMLQDPTKKITVYYEGARIEGQWLGAMRVEAKLFGYDSGNDYYLANKVELEDDEDKYEHDTET